MKTKIFILSLLSLAFISCDDVLDREPLTKATDETYWTSETKLRLYANEYYEYFFAGYNTGYRSEYAPLTGYQFSDDLVSDGNQSDFDLRVPNSGRGDNNSSTTVSSSGTVTFNIPWLASYSGPTWSYGWIRKSNIMMNRIESRMSGILSDEAKNHWLGLARFYRAMSYAGLIQVFGSVPYFDQEVSDTDFATLYKDRTPRNEVMDAVYNDFIYAFNNVRLNDGDMNVNRYVVAAYICRLALIEGSWQKYHYNDKARAEKFFKLAVEAGDFVRKSGKYDIVTDFRSLFGSKDLKGNKDCVLYRSYNYSLGTGHCVATYCNLSESRSVNANLALVKSFLCNDGKPYQVSGVTNATDFSMDELIKTRDPRFEATFWNKPTDKAKGSYLYCVKFIERSGPNTTASTGAAPAEYTGIQNQNEYPVMRYAEVLLNWIEAKAELDDLKVETITQADVDGSINKIRNRPLDAEAISKGVTQTAPLLLSALPNDPDRDSDVSALLWEIRRERRMELFFEHSRIVDLRRWKKLEYMDASQNPDILRGTWVNFPVELSQELKAANVGVIGVVNASGTEIIYNGSNGSQMVGFAIKTNIKPRQQFLNVTGINPYLSPIDTKQRTLYKTRGYNLSQTEGWSDAM